MGIVVRKVKWQHIFSYKWKGSCDSPQNIFSGNQTEKEINENNDISESIEENNEHIKDTTSSSTVDDSAQETMAIEEEFQQLIKIRCNHVNTALKRSLLIARKL